MHILFCSLTHLIIRSCPQVESFTKGYLPSNLTNLEVFGCPKLIASRLGWGLNSLLSLRLLTLGDANDESLPDIGLLPPKLAALIFYNCPNLRSLEHKGLCHLSSLEFLAFRDCPKLQYFPKEGLPRSLVELRITGCPLLINWIQKQKGNYWAKIAHIPFVEIDNEILTLSELLNDEGTSFHTIYSLISGLSSFLKETSKFGAE
ncbi:disease resistance protein RGA2-like [Prosopis cineraria]|uniref:disease resistance protein RGA2-like n=1 Tax=Prosopis cineraria TaxID=364024 RepID=UPI002410603E|nr:disease resistance protein RGA2-like [Prosopis cineraria]